MQNDEKKNNKTSKAQLRANLKYSQNRWRPNIYIDPSLREPIEKHLKSKGYRSFNEYVIALINADMKNE